jgi:hypothetical protein
MKLRTVVSHGIVVFSLSLAGAPSRAAEPEMKPIARIAAGDGVIHEAFAFADGGGQLGYVETDTQGRTLLHVGPPGGRGWSTDITTFTRDPERVVFVGGHWFVISKEGSRRALVVGPTGRIETQIGAFGEAVLSNVRGKTFVTMTDKGSVASGHAYSVAAYRPTGAPLGTKLFTIGGDGTVAGTQGLEFVAFTGGYLQALVKKSGRYDKKADVRGGTQVATLDILSGKVGPAKDLAHDAGFLHLAEKRAEQPGLETFVRRDDDGSGLELVGPSEKSRPLALPTKASLYELGSLRQQPSSGSLYFSLTVDPLNPDQVAAQKKGARALHIFEVALGSARATLVGQIPLEESETYAWAAGGKRVAVLRGARQSGRNEIAIFGR